MARIRTVKPEFFTSEQVAECSPNARLLFVGMWCFCDDQGIHPASAARLKMEVFPADDFTKDQVTDMVAELVAHDLLQEYEVEGQKYWLVTGWKHQKIDKPSKKYPLPLGEDSSNVRREVDEPSGTEGKGRDVEEEEAKAASLRSASSSAAPDDLLGNAVSQTDSGKGDLAERLARVTDEAIAAYNASPLVKSNGGHLPNVSPRIGREKRQTQVKRCLRVARSICEEGTGSPRVTAEFWRDYFGAVAQDDFYAGRRPGGPGHENFVPDFNTLTSEATMLRIYDRSSGEAA